MNPSLQMWELWLRGVNSFLGTGHRGMTKLDSELQSPGRQSLKEFNPISLARSPGAHPGGTQGTRRPSLAMKFGSFKMEAIEEQIETRKGSKPQKAGDPPSPSPHPQTGSWRGKQPGEPGSARQAQDMWAPHPIMRQKVPVGLWPWWAGQTPLVIWVSRSPRKGAPWAVREEQEDQPGGNPADPRALLRREDRCAIK